MCEFDISATHREKEEIAQELKYILLSLVSVHCVETLKMIPNRDIATAAASELTLEHLNRAIRPPTASPKIPGALSSQFLGFDGPPNSFGE